MRHALFFALSVLSLLATETRIETAHAAGTIDFVGIDVVTTGNTATAINGHLTGAVGLVTDVQTCIEVTNGATFEIDVVMDALPAGQNLAGYQFDISYNGSVIKLGNDDDGDGLYDEDTQIADDNNDPANDAVSGEEGPDGGGTFGYTPILLSNANQFSRGNGIDEVTWSDYEIADFVLSGFPSGPRAAALVRIQVTTVAPGVGVLDLRDQLGSDTSQPTIQDDSARTYAIGNAGRGDAVIVVGAPPSPHPCANDDGDDLNNGLDNCVSIPNSSQADFDDDGVGDACDPDVDGDGIADAEDRCAGTPLTERPVDSAGCPQQRVDADMDGACDSGRISTLCIGSDNCPIVSNADQANTDVVVNPPGDGLGDACDRDDDNDGYTDPAEVATGPGNAIGSDPLSPARIPEVCDSVNNDGNEGTDESFPNTDGTGQADCVDPDDDDDGFPDVGDNCPLVSNPAQVDSDGDGVGDSCQPDTDPDVDTVAIDLDPTGNSGSTINGHTVGTVVDGDIQNCISVAPGAVFNITVVLDGLPATPTVGDRLAGFNFDITYPTAAPTVGAPPNLVAPGLVLGNDDNGNGIYDEWWERGPDVEPEYGHDVNGYNTVDFPDHTADSVILPGSNDISWANGQVPGAWNVWRTLAFKLSRFTAGPRVGVMDWIKVTAGLVPGTYLLTLGEVNVSSTANGDYTIGGVRNAMVVVGSPPGSNGCDDDDADGAVNGMDNCALGPNPDQADFDRDGIGDMCGDFDGDGIMDDTDNCRTVANAGQADLDGDGMGDDCDPDDDADGIFDSIDGGWDGSTFTSRSSVFSDYFTDQHLGGVSSGRVVARGDVHVQISDLPDPGGLLAWGIGSGAPGTVEFCGATKLVLGASYVQGGCTSSAVIKVLEGTVTTRSGTLSVSIPAGAEAVIEHMGNGFSVANSSTSIADVTVNGVSIPPGGIEDDRDSDGFLTSIETFVGTSTTLACGVNAWPVDINDDHTAGLADILAYIPVFGANNPPPPAGYNPRFDLNADNKIGLQDILMFIPFFGVTCTP